MATVHGKGKPKAFEPLAEGAVTLRISDVKGIPRTNVTSVTMKMLTEDGRGWDKYPQKYDLNSDGGYAAFYFLVKNGLGIDLDEGDEFDIDQLEGKFVEVEIVHKDNPNNPDRPYVNIAKTLGPGEPFEVAGEDTEDEDEDY